jgi:hypothetical protein
MMQAVPAPQLYYDATLKGKGYYERTADGDLAIGPNFDGRKPSLKHIIADESVRRIVETSMGEIARTMHFARQSPEVRQKYESSQSPAIRVDEEQGVAVVRCAQLEKIHNAYGTTTIYSNT